MGSSDNWKSYSIPLKLQYQSNLFVMSSTEINTVQCCNLICVQWPNNDKLRIFIPPNVYHQSNLFFLAHHKQKYSIVILMCPEMQCNIGQRALLVAICWCKLQKVGTHTKCVTGWCGRWAQRDRKVAKILIRLKLMLKQKLAATFGYLPGSLKPCTSKFLKKHSKEPTIVYSKLFIQNQISLVLQMLQWFLCEFNKTK